MRNEAGHVVECHVLRLFTFDEKTEEFTREPEDELLCEVWDGQPDKGTCSFTNDFFVTQANKTFYFKRGRKDGDKTKESNGFQLWKHTMRPQPPWKGAKRLPEHPGEVRMSNYFLDLSDLSAERAGDRKQNRGSDRPLTLAELGVIFLRPADEDYWDTRKHCRREHEFLDSQYACVYRKVAAGAANLSTFARIYRLKDHKAPCVYLDKEIIYRLQCGFVWGGAASGGGEPADGAKIKFTLKGANTTYQLEYEFKEEENKENKEREEDEDKNAEEEAKQDDT